MLYKFKVTKELQQRANEIRSKTPFLEYKRSMNCPVSLALQEIFPGTGTAGYTFIPGKDPIALPQEVIDYIGEADHESSFDDTKMPELEFELEVPE